MRKITFLIFLSLISICSFAQLPGAPEDFEGTFLPAGWTKYDNGSGLLKSWVQTPGGTTGVFPAYEGNFAAVIDKENVPDENPAPQDWLVTPLVTLPNNPQLRFFSRLGINGDDGGLYRIMVSTDADPSNLAAYTEIIEWTELQINPIQQDYTEKIVQLTGLGGQSVYIAFVMEGDDADRWLVDYVRLVEECLPPTALNASNFGLETADLSWTSPAGVDTWEIEIIEAALPATGSGEIYNGTLPYQADGLDENTDYKFYVRSVCGTGNTSEWAGPFNFGTAALGETCAAPIEIATLPYSTTDNTSNYGDDYSGSPGASGCGSTNNYLNGDDVVYAYTATADGAISIDMTGTGNAAGIFVYDDCADIGVNCIAGGVGDSTTPVSLATVPVIGGTTYYIVISTWANPQSTPYTLTVQVVNCPPPTNLSATNIDNDSADLSWDANGATSWEIVVQNAGSGIPPGAGTTITTNTNYNVTATTGGTPFTEATTYEYYVRADCGDGSFSAWGGPYVFMTTQVPAAMDFTDDFEGAAGWSLSNGTAVNQWVIGNATNNGGANSLYITNDAGVTNSFDNNTTSVVHAYRDIQMPAAVDQLLLSYDWKAVGESCCDYLRVWVVPATFVPTAGTQITAASGGTQFGGNQNMNSTFTTANYVVDAAAYSGQVMRLIFEWRNDGSLGTNPPAAVDNINLSVITCPAPTNLALDDLQINQATISWDGPTSVTPTFDYYLSTTNTPPTDTTDPTDNVSAENAVLDPLDDSTGYFVWVRSNCGSGDTSFWVGPLAFNTPQIPADLNFYDDFEDGTVEWTLNNGTQPNQWIVGTATSNGTGSSLYITNDGGTSNAFTNNTSSVVHAYRDLQMPATPTSEISVSFDWKAVGESCCDYLRVWVVPVTFTPTPGTQITAGDSGGVQITPGNLNMNPDWTTENYVVDASGYTGQIVRLIFEWRNDGSVGTDPPAAVDNVNVAVITCPAPDNLVVSNITENSATITWDPPVDLPDSYDYYLSNSNTTPAPDATVTGNVDPTTVDLADLDPSTTYYIWVRSNCGTDDYSFWVGPLVFNTTQIPADTNFYDDFEDGTVEWTLNNGTQPNQWVVGSAVSNSPDNALYISNDGGTSNTYTNNSSSTVHAYRDIAIPSTVVGEAILQFDWLAVGESCCDYLKAWIVPVTYTPTPGTLIPDGTGEQFGENFNQSGDWTTESYIFDASVYAGQTVRLIFEWRNDGSVGTNPPAAVDNVLLQILTCPAPVDLLSSGIQGTSFVELSWTPVGSETQWEIVVQEMGTGNPGPTPTESVIVDEPTYTLDIEEGVYYEYYVRAICDETDLSLWAGPLVFSIFNPPGCANVEVFDPELELLLPDSEIVICPGEDNCVPLTANYLQTGETTSYEIESIEYAPPFPFTGGTPVSVGTDDVWSPTVELPFDFCFFGEIYTEVLVGSNGVVTFDTTDAGGYCPWPFSTTIPNTGFPILNAIYGVYQDIDPNQDNDVANPDINYQVLGNYPCRALVVNFSEVAQFSGACNDDPAIGGQTTQIVLYEISNVIEIYIGNRVPCTSWQNGVGVCGLQNAAGTEAFVPPGRNTGAWTAIEEAWRFTPNGDSNVVFEWLQDGVTFSDQEEITVCVTDPTTMTARATYTNCNGELLVRETNVMLRLAEEIEEQDPIDLSACSTSGSATFNLPDSMVDIIAGLDNPENFTFTYYLTEEAANLGGDDNLADSYTTNGNQTIYVRVQENGSDCFTVWSFDITIENNPPQFSLDGDFDVCEGETVTITVNPINFDTTEATYSWTFEGAALPDTGSSITATESGVYEVVVDRNGCTASEAVEVTITPLPTADVMENVTQCDSYTLPALSAGNTYYTGSGATGDMLAAGTEITTDQTIYIFAQVEGTDCSDESSFTVSIVPTPVLGITGGCEGGIYMLEVSLDSNYNEQNTVIEWTGPSGAVVGTGLTITAEELGDYMVTVTPAGGDICSSVLVQTVDNIACLIPRGISPNNDGMNDNFDLRGFGVAKLSIFNRYGKEVYSKSGYTNEWYGQEDNGNDLPTGTYFYSLELNNGDSKTGWVYINRQEN